MGVSERNVRGKEGWMEGGTEGLESDGWGCRMFFLGCLQFFSVGVMKEESENLGIYVHRVCLSHRTCVFSHSIIVNSRDRILLVRCNVNSCYNLWSGRRTRLQQQQGKRHDSDW